MAVEGGGEPERPSAPGRRVFLFSGGGVAVLFDARVSRRGVAGTTRARGTLRALDGAGRVRHPFLFRRSARFAGRVRSWRRSRALTPIAFVCTGAGVGAARGSPCALTVGDERQRRRREARRFCSTDGGVVHGAEYVGGRGDERWRRGRLDVVRPGGDDAGCAARRGLRHPALSAHDRRAIRTLYPPGMGEGRTKTSRGKHSKTPSGSDERGVAAQRCDVSRASRSRVFRSVIGLL